MNITIAYNKEVYNIVKVMKNILEQNNFDVEIFVIRNEESGSFQYRLFSNSKLIIIGLESPSWGDEIPAEFEKFIGNCPFIAGKQVAVFVTRKIFGSPASLKHLMKMVEENGGFVFDFEIIGDEKSAEEFAQRLTSIKDTI